jgi:hypothetical protein
VLPERSLLLLASDWWALAVIAIAYNCLLPVLAETWDHVLNIAN